MNSLSIRRSTFEDVTECPHFPIDLRYEGHHLSFEDIYFNEDQKIPNRLRDLEAHRGGEVLLDGGYRVKLWLTSTPTGGIELSFRMEECEPQFPGRIIIEGSFPIEGEYARSLIDSIRRLFTDGTPVTIESDDRNGR